MASVTFKNSGELVKFLSASEAPIRHLKVHFSPKQEGTGDPSPENVRPISGWNEITTYKAGKNLYNINGVRAHGHDDWDTIMTGDKAKVNTTNYNRWTFVTIAIPGEKYTFIPNCYEVGFLDKDENVLQYWMGWNKYVITAPTNAKYIYLTWYKNGTNTAEAAMEWHNQMYLTYANTTVDVKDYEPYTGQTITTTFPVLGKNKFNWNVSASESSPTGSDPSTAREFVLNTYVIGMSVNNYYRQNYTNWVLNPSVENGVISFSSGTASGYGIGFPLSLAAGQRYYLSGTVTNSGTAGAIYYDKDGNLISYQASRLNNTLLIPNNTVTTVICFYSTATNTSYTFSNIQLELGSTATTYEPYDPNNTVYGGYVDLVTGEVVKTWKLGGINDINITAPNSNSSGAWAHRFSIRGSWVNDTVGWANVGGAFGWVCDRVKHVNNCSNNYEGYSGSGVLYFYDDTINTVDEFKTKYADMQIAFAIKEAIYETHYLSPSQLTTLRNTNYFWSNADSIEVEYDLAEPIDVLQQRKQMFLASAPHIVTPAPAKLQSFTTDMKAPLKECKIYFEPTQEGSGDPSPSNVRAIGGLTELDVYTSKKNLLSSNLSDYTIIKTLSSDFTMANNSMSGTVTVGDRDKSAIKTKTIFPSGTYTVSFDFNSTIHEISSNIWRPINIIRKTDDWYADQAGMSFISGSSSGHVSKTFTMNEPFYITIALHNFGSAAETGINTISNFQLEFGSEETTFEPYNTTYPISWSSSGTVYGGYVDLVSGEVWKTWEKSTVRNIFTKVYTYGTTKVFWSDIIGDVSSGKSDIVSNEYPTISGLMPFSQVPNMADSSLAIRYTYGNLILKDTQYTTVEELHIAMGDVEICYHVVTPTLITTLTPTQLKTLRGQNNIWSNANDNVEIKYYKH